jgi:hypothetical protein
MTNYGLRQNHRKIIGKTKKSAFCVPYSVVWYHEDRWVSLNATAKNAQVDAILMKTGLNNALLPTLFTVVNNIEQYLILLHPIQAQQYC